MYDNKVCTIKESFTARVIPLGMFDTLLSPVDATVNPIPVLLEFAILEIATSYVISPAVELRDI